MLFQFLLTKFSKSEPVSCLNQGWKRDQLLQKKRLITRELPATPTQGFSPPIFYGKRPAHEVDA